jgi:anti-sigma regulatory factor (Ser/Thr protein kinase)
MDFRVCPDQVVVQPFEVKALLDKAENELARVAEEKAIFRQEVLLRFATVDKCIDRANEFGAKLFERSGLDDEGQVAFCAAFREAIGNAAQHGNRFRKDKTIEVLYLLDQEKITVNVTDQGKGFDHKLYTHRGAGGDAIAAARERHQQGRLGGLGIMLMMKCTDKLEYNEAGNSVTLTKSLKKKG